MQGRAPAQAMCHLQPQGAWPAHCLWPSVSLQLRWPSLKFQLLWGHPALSPTNAPSPKSQPPLRRTQVSSALTHDQEKLPPASGSPPRAWGLRTGSDREPTGQAASGAPTGGTQAQQSVGLQGPLLRSQLHTRAQGGADLPRPQGREEEGQGEPRHAPPSPHPPPLTDAHWSPDRGSTPSPGRMDSSSWPLPSTASWHRPTQPSVTQAGMPEGKGAGGGQAEWTPRNRQDTAG